MSLPFTIDLAAQADLSGGAAQTFFSANQLVDGNTNWVITSHKFVSPAGDDFNTPGLVSSPAIQDGMFSVYIPSWSNSFQTTFLMRQNSTGGLNQYVIEIQFVPNLIRVVNAGFLTQTTFTVVTAFTPVNGTAYWFSIKATGVNPTVITVKAFARIGSDGSVPPDFFNGTPLGSWTISDSTSQMQAPGKMGLGCRTTSNGAEVQKGIWQSAVATLTSGDLLLTAASTTGVTISTTTTGGTGPNTYNLRKFTDSTCNVGTAVMVNGVTLPVTVALADNLVHYFQIDTVDSAGSPATVSTPINGFTRLKSVDIDVFIGDSITAGNGASAVSLGSLGYFVPQVYGPTNANSTTYTDWPSVCGLYRSVLDGPRQVSVMNAGAGGTKPIDWVDGPTSPNAPGGFGVTAITTGLSGVTNLWRQTVYGLGTYLGNAFTPTNVWIQLGTNNAKDGAIATGLSNYQRDMALLIAQIRAQWSTTRIILCRPPLTQQTNINDSRPDRNALYDNMAAWNTSQADGVHIVALGSPTTSFAFTAADQYPSEFETGGTGLHYSDKGYRDMALWHAHEYANVVGGQGTNPGATAVFPAIGCSFIKGV